MGTVQTISTLLPFHELSRRDGEGTAQRSHGAVMRGGRQLRLTGTDFGSGRSGGGASEGDLERSEANQDGDARGDYRNVCSVHLSILDPVYSIWTLPLATCSRRKLFFLKRR